MTRSKTALAIFAGTLLVGVPAAATAQTVVTATGLGEKSICSPRRWRPRSWAGTTMRRSRCSPLIPATRSSWKQ